MTTNAFSVSLLGLVSLCICGCQTAKVTQANTNSQAGQVAKADTVFVKSFDVSKATFKGDYSDVKLINDADRQRISRIISQAMIDGLTTRGFLAKPFAGEVPAGAVVVEGDVTEVDKGSLSKRFLVGMGAGSASMKAKVRIVRTGSPDSVLADLELVGSGGFYGSSGGMWANEDWIGIYSASLGYKIAQYISGNAKK